MIQPPNRFTPTINPDLFRNAVQRKLFMRGGKEAQNLFGPDAFDNSRETLLNRYRKPVPQTQMHAPVKPMQGPPTQVEDAFYNKPLPQPNSELDSYASPRPNRLVSAVQNRLQGVGRASHKALDRVTNTLGAGANRIAQGARQAYQATRDYYDTPEKRYQLVQMLGGMLQGIGDTEAPVSLAMDNARQFATDLDNRLIADEQREYEHSIEDAKLAALHQRLALDYNKYMQGDVFGSPYSGYHRITPDGNVTQVVDPVERETSPGKWYTIDTEGGKQVINPAGEFVGDPFTPTGAGKTAFHWITDPETKDVYATQLQSNGSWSKPVMVYDAPESVGGGVKPNDLFTQVNRTVQNLENQIWIKDFWGNKVKINPKFGVAGSDGKISEVNSETITPLVETAIDAVLGVYGDTANKQFLMDYALSNLALPNRVLDQNTREEIIDSFTLPDGTPDEEAISMFVDDYMTRLYGPGYDPELANTEMQRIISELQ